MKKSYDSKFAAIAARSANLRQLLQLAATRRLMNANSVLAKNKPALQGFIHDIYFIISVRFPFGGNQAQQAKRDKNIYRGYTADKTGSIRPLYCRASVRKYDLHNNLSC